MIIKDNLTSWLEPVKVDRQTRVRLIAVWTVCLVVVLTLLFTVLVPGFKGYLDNQIKIKALSVRLSRYQKKYNQLSSIDQLSLDQKIKGGTEVLPLYHNAPLLLAVLSGLSQEHKVKLSSLNFTPGEVASESVSLKSGNIKSETKNVKLPETLPLKPLKLKFQASGQLEDIRQFLISLEKIKPITRVEKVSLNLNPESPLPPATPSAQSAKGFVTSFIEVEFYAVSLPKKMPGLETPLYIVPQNLEDIYAKVMQDYRGFTSRSLTSPTPPQSRRPDPFSYPAR